MSITLKISRTRLFTDIYKMEDELSAREDVLHAVEDSPTRFDILQGRLARGGEGPPKRLLPIMISCVLGIRRSLRTLEDNPPDPISNAEPSFIEELEQDILKLGASSVGYTKVPPRWVFQEKAIAYDNAIVFAMEMDKDRIDSAPSIPCMTTVMETYRDQGRIANKVAAKLRRKGFGAHAGHPLNGMALYPPLAQSAGLGWIGLNGIIITPEHGPRVRLAAVFTSIDNLPFSEENPHGWIEEYCRSCRVCIKKCPPGALYGEPEQHENGRMTFVENELCFPYFNDYYGCSVCVAVCPFNNVSYANLRELKTHTLDRMGESVQE